VVSASGPEVFCAATVQPGGVLALLKIRTSGADGVGAFEKPPAESCRIGFLFPFRFGFFATGQRGDCTVRDTKIGNVRCR
jgi:hypothetical protein